jgi:hypothetical protein
MTGASARSAPPPELELAESLLTGIPVLISIRIDHIRDDFGVADRNLIFRQDEQDGQDEAGSWIH